MKRKYVKQLLVGILTLSCIMASVPAFAKVEGKDAQTTEAVTEAEAEAGTEAAAESETEAAAEETTEAQSDAAAAPAQEDSFVLTDDDGNITFKAGIQSDEKVTDAEQAQALVNRMKEELGGNPESNLVFESVLSAEHINIYNFIQELYGDVITDAVVKVITGEDGTVFGLVSSLNNDETEYYAEPITAEEAENIVRDKVLGEGGKVPKILKGETTELLLPGDVAELGLGADNISAEEAESEEGLLLSVWAVYSKNDSSHLDARPYLVHYVEKNGTYLYSMPVYGPRSWEAENAVDHSAVYEGLTEEPWTTTVTDYDGSAREITIPVMKDADGNIYLCTKENRIVMADYYDYAIAPGDVPASDDNITVVSNKEQDFSVEALLTYDYFLRIHAFFKTQGWDSPDGVGTDSLLLFNYCDANGNPVENCMYVGCRMGGWQTFAFSDGFGFGYCPDVMAHEFTHCITHSTMLYSPYVNDVGAINEAMSDVVGKLAEVIILDKHDENWVMGGEVMPLRFMHDPHIGRQPEFVWDQYYVPATCSPCDLNDNGGVHINSSLMNSVAWKLHEAGMPELDELNYWLAVNCCLSAKTDYPQLAKMLPWVMQNIGYEEYLPVLTEAIAAAQMDRTELPETLADGCGMVKIPLPDSETFWNEDFKVSIMNLDTEVGDYYYPVPQYDGIVTVLPEGDYLAQITYVNADAEYCQMSYTADGWIEGIIEEENLQDAMIEVEENETVTLTNENLENITLAPHDVFEKVMAKVNGGEDPNAEPSTAPVWDTGISPEITPEQREVFDKAFEMLMGVSYEPLAVLGTMQDSTGIVYCVLCKATVVYPDAVPSNVLVYIHEDAQGNVSVNNVWELWIDEHSRK